MILKRCCSRPRTLTNAGASIVMKKTIIGILVGLIVLAVAAVVGVWLALDSLVKKGVEHAGPQVAKVEVRLGSVSISPFSGSGVLKNLVVGNPEGFKSDSSLKAGSVSLRLQPRTVFGDKLVIEEIDIRAPEVTFEGGLQGGNNLSKLLENIQSSVGPGNTNAAPTEEKKLQVNRFAISGAKVHLILKDLADQGTTIPIPDIELTNLGTGPEGITASALAQQASRELLDRVVAAASKAAVKMATDKATAIGKEALQDPGKAAKDLQNLFKKK